MAQRKVCADRKKNKYMYCRSVSRCQLRKCDYFSFISPIKYFSFARVHASLQNVCPFVFDITTEDFWFEIQMTIQQNFGTLGALCLPFYLLFILGHRFYTLLGGGVSRQCSVTSVMYAERDKTQRKERLHGYTAGSRFYVHVRC